MNAEGKTTLLGAVLMTAVGRAVWKSGIEDPHKLTRVERGEK